MASLDTTAPAEVTPQAGWRYALKLLRGDAFALASLVYLILLVAGATFGPEVYADVGTKMNLALRNAPPLSLEHGYLYVLGADSLGRPIVPRLLVAARTTLLVSVSVVLCSMVAGAILGLLAGYYDRVVGSVIMRIADMVMSFPSLLLAVIVLFVMEPRAANVVIVLAITRTPVFVRVTRAEVLEVRERLFVESARAAGAPIFVSCCCIFCRWWHPPSSLLRHSTSPTSCLLSPVSVSSASASNRRTLPGG